MDNTCWPHVILMVIQGRMHSSQHGPWVTVYKVDYFVLGTLLSSLVLLNTRVVLSLKRFELQFITSMAIIVMNASIKNDFATSISHIHFINHSLTKMVHHAAFITSTEVELLQLGAVSTKHAIRRTYSKSSLSLISSTQQGKFLIVNPIHIKFILWPSLANYVASLLSARKILSNFGNAPAVSTGDSTKSLTRI